MPIDFHCPYCQREISAPDAAAGNTGTCHFCGATLIAPPESGQAAQLLNPGRSEALPETPPEWSGYQGYPAAPMGVLDIGQTVSEAWNMVMKNWQRFVPATVIVFGASLVVQGLQQALIMSGSGNSELMLFLTYPVVFALIPLQYGLYVMAIESLRTGTTTVDAVFRAYKRFWTCLGVTLLTGFAIVPFAAIGAGALVWSISSKTSSLPIVIAVTIAVIASVIASAYVYLGLMLAPVAVLDRGMGATEAIAESWEAARGQRLLLFGLSIVATLLLLAGYVACCVGILVTMPVYMASFAIAYRQLRGLEGPADAPAPPR